MSIVPSGFASPSVRRFDPPAADDLQPVTAVGFVPDAHTLLRGNPVIPTFWARADHAASAEGLYYVSRPALEDVQSSAFVRFVANDDTWDPVACVWSPLISQAAGNYQMDSNLAVAPALVEMDYQIGKELLQARALSLNPNRVLTSDFDEGFDSAYSFTLAMALNVRGLSFNPITFLDGSYIGVRPTGLVAFFNGLTFTVPMPRSPQSVLPLVLVLEVSPPSVKLTAGLSPTMAWTGSSSVAERTTSFVFTLSGDMDLFSLDIWGDDAPSLPEILAGYTGALGTSR